MSWPRSPIRRMSCTVATVLIGLSPPLLGTMPRPKAILQERQSVGPFALTPGDRQTVYGFLYTPEILDSLLRQEIATSPSERLARAAKFETPIVVMWSIPNSVDVDPVGRPYRMAIVEPSVGLEFAVRHPLQRIEPLWIDQQATDLGELDRRVRRDDVGAMAAFPRSAFIPGRRICLYSESRLDGGGVRVQIRSTTIEWDGNQRAER